MTPLFPNINQVFYPENGLPVEQTAAETFCKLNGGTATAASNGATGLWIAMRERSDAPDSEWIYAQISTDGTGEISASQPSFLYAGVKMLFDGLSASQLAQVQQGGLYLPVAFDWLRPSFDHVLTQVSRSARNLDVETYIEKLAASGHTHIEVNGLATHIPFEYGVPDEYYNQFYTYCAGLNQFVESPLTKGIYPIEYLAHNLNYLKKLVKLGHKYGLKPGITCFEPRTLPEHFFQKYPTLRGARVDHPFRSHVPRYTLAQDHPLTRQHYRYMIQSLMESVPDLAFMSVWANDSGAGFEHMAALYVGRNGGPYLIREWRSHDKVAEAAGNSAVRWLRNIQEAAAEINPDFVVSLRIEPFKVEHDHLLNGMGKGVTFEAPSLLVRGWHLPYSHPQYPEQQSIAGSIFHSEMDAEEKEKLEYYRSRDIEPILNVATSTSFNVEPLLGISFPRSLYQKLKAVKETGMSHINAFGGLMHIEKTPYWVNFEVLKQVQLNAEKSIDDILQDAATKWVGEEHSAKLIEMWDRFEAAVMNMPVIPLYSHFGFVWYRAWVRPIVGNLEAPTKQERAYYDRYVVTMLNNPNNNDLGRDVLFELITPEQGKTMGGYFDQNVFPILEKAIAEISDLLPTLAADSPAFAVFNDLRDRMRILHCWAMTQRNTCVWIHCVNTYMNSTDEATKAEMKVILQEMIDRDVANTHHLIDLWENSTTETLMISGKGETSFIYGENFGELLRKKLHLIEKYRDVEPFIDREIMWRVEYDPFKNQ
jgi:hypothetical protein